MNTIILLLLVQVAFSEMDPAKAESCNTEEMRRAAVDNALASIGCDDYDCGKLRCMQCLQHMKKPVHKQL